MDRTRPQLFRSILLLGAMLGLLSACGFHLRGSYPLPAEIQQVLVSGPVEMTRELKRQLQASGVTLASRADDQAWQLLLREYEREQRTISFDQQVESAEYEISRQIEFSLYAPDGLLIMGPVTLQNARTQIHDKSRLLGSGAEADLLYEEMAIEDARRIMRMLERLSGEDIRAARDAHAAAAAQAGS